MWKKMELIERNRNIQDVRMLSPLVWAYIGDSVYEIFIRNNLINNSNAKPHKLHIETVKFVKAKAQVQTLNKIYDDLTDEEKDIVRRGRNVQNHHVPKNVDVAEYAYATAFEALLGFLYLSKQDERLKELLNKCLD
ncbi:MAG: Mini-ribonuclease 3 [Clostridia bacterium]|nr:Mini-ribonuclease 3 [Clostridia bacterium]